MNFRHTAILFGALLLGVAILLAYTWFDESPSDETLLAGLGSVKPEQVDAVEFERSEPPATLKLARDAKGQWSVTEPIQARADSDAVNAVVRALLKAKPITIPDMPAASAAGLQPPSLKVTLRQGTERSGTLNLGEVRSGGGGVVFVSTTARPDRPIAVPRNDLSPLFRATPGGGDGRAGDLAKWTADYRVKSVFPTEPTRAGEDVTALKLSLPNKKKELALSRGAAGGWKFDVPAGWGEADSVGDVASAGTFTGVRPLVQALVGLRAAGPDDFVDNPKDLKEYGLNPDNPDLVRVEMRTKESPDPVVVYLGKREGPPIMPTAPPTPGSANKVWVRVEGQPGVIRASAGDLAGLIPVIENPDPLRDRNLLASDKSRIDGLDITVGGQTTKLRKAGALPEWKLYGNPAAGDPQPAAAQAVNRMLDVLTEKRTIKSFPPANPADFTPGEVKAEVKVWADGLEPATDPKAEPKEKGKPTVLVFGRKEGDSIHVRRTLPDGTTSEFVMPERVRAGVGPDTVDLVETVARRRLDLLDPTLKTFATDAVNKITVGGAANYELEKDEKKDPSTNTDRWTFLAPPDRKGQTADAATVAEMLRILGTTQSVSRFVDETPSPEKLAEYGLAPASPRMKVTIGLKTADPADKERVYLFGKETADPNYVYAQQAGRAAVFTVPKLVFDRFAHADLRDRAIFRFDPASIAGIEIKGWGKTGLVFELHAEKNTDGVWVPSKPKEFALDPAKVNAFLTLLSKTTVKSFVPGPQTPEQGFGNEKEYLHILLKPANGGPIAIQLGNPTPDGQAYYGWTSVLPPGSQVFTVDAAPLKPYKESYGAFAK
jgi:hypothetical protein